MMETNDPEAFKLSLAKMRADNPDFMLDLGDTFFIDRYLRLGPITSEQITDRVRLLRSYFDLINHSVPLFLVNGNHEGEWGRHLDGTWGFDEARPGWAMPIHQLSEGGLRPDVPARRSMQS